MFSKPEVLPGRFVAMIKFICPKMASIIDSIQNQMTQGIVRHISGIVELLEPDSSTKII